MEIVANMFDRDGCGLIDYKEFVSALRPDREVGTNLWLKVRLLWNSKLSQGVVPFKKTPGRMIMKEHELGLNQKKRRSV